LFSFIVLRILFAENKCVGTLFVYYAYLKAMIFIGKPNVPMAEEVGYFLSNIGIRLWQCGDLPLYLQQKY